VIQHTFLNFDQNKKTQIFKKKTELQIKQKNPQI